jgi:Ssp1 endopeptidase immunity protein Rap1a
MERMTMVNLLRIAFLLLIITIGFEAISFADHFEINARDFFDYCKLEVKHLDGFQSLTTREIRKASSCQKHVMGFINSHLLKKNNPALYCKPSEVTLNQITRVFVKYGGDHPEELPGPGSEMFLNSLKTAYPCH